MKKITTSKLIFNTLAFAGLSLVSAGPALAQEWPTAKDKIELVVVQHLLQGMGFRNFSVSRRPEIKRIYILSNGVWIYVNPNRCLRRILHVAPKAVHVLKLPPSIDDR